MPSGPNEASHIRIITGVAIAGFCVFLQFYAPQPLLVLFSEYFAASEAQVSLIVSVAALAVALASPFVGTIADAVGRKRVIVPCLFAISLSTVGCALSSSLDELIFWRFIGGVCTPGVLAVTLAYISEESPQRSASVTSLYISGTVLGGLTGRVTAAVIAEHASWRWSMGALAIMTLLGAIACWAFLPRAQQFRRETQWRRSLSAMWQHLRNGRLIATYACGFTVLFSHVGLFTYLNFYLAAPPFSLSTSALGLVFLVYALGIVATPLAGRLVDRTNHRSGVAIGVALVASGALLTLAPSLTLCVLGAAIASTGVFVAQATASSHVGRAAHGARSAATGLYVASYYFGGSVGATALVVPWHSGGWPAIVLTILVVQVISLTLAWKYFVRVPTSQPAQPLTIE